MISFRRTAERLHRRDRKTEFAWAKFIGCCLCAFAMNGLSCAGESGEAVSKDSGVEAPSARVGSPMVPLAISTSADQSQSLSAGLEERSSTRLASLPAANRRGFRIRAFSRDDADAADQRRPAAEARSVEPVAAGPGSLFPNERDLGVYPTKREWETIGGYYERRIGDSPGGGESDRNTQAPAGLWPYPSSADRFLFGRNSRFLEAVDRTLGLFAPDGVIAYEGKNLSTGGLFSFSGSLPFLTRAFNPERAMLKLGPVYLDVLSVSGTLLYSDYHGPEHFRHGEEDGWLGIATMDVRVVVQLAENLFLAATAGVYYLPFKNRAGLYLGDGGGLGLGLGLNFLAAYEKEINGWWLTFTDRLGSVDRFGADYFDSFKVDEIDVAGRYRFGREPEGGGSPRHFDFFSPKRFYLYNTAQFSVIGLLNPNWRLSADVTRTDGYDVDSNGSNFDNYRGQMRANARIAYAGQDWRFAPFAAYGVSMDDRFDNFIHQAVIGISGPITQQLRITSQVGYAWSHSVDGPFSQSLVYELGLIHELGPYTRHSLFGGNVVSETDFAGRRIGRYAAYTLDQTISRRVKAGLFAQWSDSVDVDREDRAESIRGGVRLSLSVTDFTRINLQAIYDRSNPDRAPDSETYLYTAGIEHRIRAGLSASLIYRHEQFDSLGGPGDFHEDLYQLTLTQVF